MDGKSRKQKRIVLFNKLGKKQQSNSLQICDDKNNLITEDDNIMKFFNRFHSTLYTSKN